MPAICCPNSPVAFALLGQHRHFRADDREAAAGFKRIHTEP